MGVCIIIMEMFTVWFSFLSERVTLVGCRVSFAAQPLRTGTGASLLSTFRTRWLPRARPDPGA